MAKKTVVLRGGTLAMQRQWKRLLRLPRMLVMESQEMTAAQAVDDALSVFLFKPDQTGFSAVAEMTAQSIQNPESSVVLSIPSDNETDSQEAERWAVNDVLKEAGIPVITDLDDAGQQIEKLAGIDGTNQGNEQNAV